MNLKDKLIKLRKDNSLTQDELAEKLYVSRQTVSNWENGKFYPDIETLILISNTFNIPLDDLLKADKNVVIDIDKKIKSHKKLKITIILLIIILFTSLFIGYRYHKTHKKVIKKVTTRIVPEGYTVWGNTDERIISQSNLDLYVNKYINIYEYTKDFYENKPEPLVSNVKVLSYESRFIAIIVSDDDYIKLKKYSFSADPLYIELANKK